MPISDEQSQQYTTVRSFKVILWHFLLLVNGKLSYLQNLSFHRHSLQILSRNLIEDLAVTHKETSSEKTIRRRYRGGSLTLSFSPPIRTIPELK